MGGMMFAGLVRVVRENRRLIVVCFELFWIVVAILLRESAGNVQSIPGFVYVNF
jgi:hypothetical protein